MSIRASTRSTDIIESSGKEGIFGRLSAHYTLLPDLHPQVSIAALI